ncbi:MAG: galactokinase [Desulfamplus sp.]
MNFKTILEQQEIKSSVPCRIDLGGTLDISTFFLPLGYLNPATFNIALNMRTTVTLSPWRDGYIKISSKGFESAEFAARTAPFNHQMGLMFAVVRFFNGSGVHVQIESTSPPRSALGGSSSAAVAMIAAFKSAINKAQSSNIELSKQDVDYIRSININSIDPAQISMLAHYIESSVAGVPCGLQDQLAAAYGGVNCWYWRMGENGISFTQDNLLAKQEESSKSDIGTISDGCQFDINNNILVAYCGIPHVSSDINRRWVNSFLAGENRDKWELIIKITRDFSNAVKTHDFNLAADLMNQETQIRLDMTPDVLDKTGKLLFECAKKLGCGARFTGAGGGGCLWAVGEKSNIAALKNGWKNIVDKEPAADILKTKVDFDGILLH